jgi:ketosteroid isomerase-like protein
MSRAFLLSLLACMGCSAPPATFRAILERQAEAWNRGDIDGFMQDYWQSEELTFSSGGQTRQGWTATRERYRANYPTRAEMGTLRFTVNQTQMLGTDAGLVLGQWDLARASGPIGGNFSLVFRRIDGRWVIVHDHTSVREAPAAATQSGLASAGMRSVSAGCAMCIFHMPGVQSCVLAVKLDGHDYLVEGRGIDDFGDAHAANGLCNVARPALARGAVRESRFHADEMRLLP